MFDTRNISVRDYTYTLPDERIAKYSLEERDASRLLHYHSGKTEDLLFRQLPGLMKKNDLLVFNCTCVIHVRRFCKSSDTLPCKIFIGCAAR